MVNVIIPIIQNAKGYKKIITDISFGDDVEIYIGIISSQLANLKIDYKDNIHIIEYQDSSKREEIINAIQKFIQSGELIIMRKPITFNEFKSFLNKGTDIVVCKTNYSPIKRFFFYIWQKILRLCLGVKLYEGDTSVIYFGEDLSSVLLQGNNLSYSSRVNRWKGTEQGSVIIEGNPVKTEVDNKEIIKYVIFSLVSLIIGATVTTLVSIFAHVSIIIGLFLFCLDAICLAISLLLVVVIIFNIIVGKRKFGSALEVNYIYGFEDSFKQDEEGSYEDDDNWDIIEEDEDEEN